MKKKLIAILCAVAMLVPMAVMPASALAGWTTYNQPTDIDYSFVVFGDMQSMTWTDNRHGTTYVKSAFDWILNNKDSRKIEYVFGLGDSIDTLTTYSTNVVEGNGKTQNVNEWILVSDQFHRLDGVIPYTVVRGNHDDEGGYHKYICTDDYVNQMNGFYYDSSKPATLGNSMSNSFKKIEIGDTKYLMLSIDYNADSNVLAWANNVVSSNPDHRVIASVHAYLNGTTSSGVGKLVNSNNGFYVDNIGAANADNSVQVNTPFDGQVLWDNLFSKHENMFMVLCGHDAIATPVHNVRTGDNENNVIEILTDTSKFDLENVEKITDDEGNVIETRPANYGANLMMLLNFREDSNEIQIEYFSPSRKAAGYSNYHLSGEQISLEYQDIVIKDVIKPTTKDGASTRISVESPGLRFKTHIPKSILDALIDSGAKNVSVGTLIAPMDILQDKGITVDTANNKCDGFKYNNGLTLGTDFVDVVVSQENEKIKNFGDFRDNAFSVGAISEYNPTEYYTFAGSLANIKTKNLDRKFVGRGYISYVDDNGVTQYIYSDTVCIRSIDYVATAALADTTKDYSLEARAILEKLTVKYYENLVKDPFEEDPFYVAEN